MPKKNTTLTQEWLSEQLKLYSGRQIATMLGISHSTVSLAMRRFGLQASPEVIQRQRDYGVSLNKARLAKMSEQLRGPNHPNWKGGAKASSARYNATTRKTEAHRVKTRARLAVREALRDGRLVRGACEVCGSANAQAHHDDYTKRLQVRWLCAFHHNRHHTEERKKK